MANQPYTDDPAPYADELAEESPRASDALLPLDYTADEDDLDGAPLSTTKPNRRRCVGALRKVLFGIGCIAMIILLALSHTLRGPRRKSSDRLWKQKPTGDKKSKNAVAYKLDFPALYPDITSEAGSECRAVWDNLTSVPCHDKLFDRSSDNGTSFPLRWDPMYFLPKMCTARCKDALEDAYSELSAKCSSADSFILNGYDGMFGTQWLEAGPIAAVEKLLQRDKHMCRSSPTGDSDYEFCPIEMLQRFAITDGVNANLNGITSFLEYTRERKVEQAQWHRGMRGSKKYSYRYNYHTRQQLYGPNDGETSCGWCTFDYLNRTLSSWTEGAILSPDSDQAISLPEFINRVATAGKRCAPTGKWDKIYEEAMTHYIDAGVLPANWKTTLPSGDLPYLIKNGPSLGDSPVSDIYAEIARISSPEFEETWNGTTGTIPNSKVCLSALGELYTSAKCYINLAPETLSNMMNEESKKLREAYCSQDCSDVIDSRPIRSKSGAKCHQADRTPETRQFFKDYTNAKRQRESYCTLLGTKSWNWDCAKALVSMDATEWALKGRPISPDFLIAVDKGLDEIKTRLIPEELREAFEKDNQMLASSPIAKNVTDRKWIREVGNSVCAGCIWNWLAGKREFDRVQYLSQVSSTSDYVEMAKKYHSTCTALGADWLGGVPYGDDPVIWRVKDNRGNIMRYVESGYKSFNGYEVYGVNEATGMVSIYSEKRETRPGIDIGSIWHVLQAERGLKATREGRGDEWRLEEQEHRSKADKEIWDIGDRWSGVRYIGPKGGFGEKKQQS